MNRLSRPGQLRAMTALMLLGPATPMLFQGQEFGASSPFYYFADHEGDLARQVMKGRSKFLKQFRSLATIEVQARLPQPHARETFERSKLDWSERERHTEALALHADLLQLRRTEPVLQCPRRGEFDGAVLSPNAFLLRYFGESGEDRLLVVNFGVDLWLSPAPEPLLAPPEGSRWGILWSSEDPRYGGCGTAPVDTEKEGWRIPGSTAVFLCPKPKERVQDEMERTEDAPQQA